MIWKYHCYKYLFLEQCFFYLTFRFVCKIKKKTFINLFQNSDINVHTVKSRFIYKVPD